MLQVEAIRAVLKKEIGLPIVEISDKSAKLHGSDILFTGKKYMTRLENISIFIHKIVIR